MTDTVPIKAADAHGEIGLRATSVYVYEAPVRLWHWVNAACILALIVTGYLIGSPLPSLEGEASAHYLMGNVRFVHFAAGQTLAFAFLCRAIWAIFGNAHSRQLFYVPLWKASYWSGLWLEARWYAFLARRPNKYVGHNPLANLAMFLMFTLVSLFMICTGFALYSEGAGIDSWQAKAFGWVFLIWPNSQIVHTLHHLGMWVMVTFILIHVYAAVREDIASRQTMISAMTTGWRYFRDNEP